MGFLFRVRLSSFFAGAATASVVGFYLLYKDYMLAHDVMSQKMKGIQETCDQRSEALNRRITALENAKEEAVTPSAALE